MNCPQFVLLSNSGSPTHFGALPYGCAAGAVVYSGVAGQTLVWLRYEIAIKKEISNEISDIYTLPRGR